MEKRPKSQTEAILEYLAAGNQLTPMDALRLFGSLRLGARIQQLRKQGHVIYTARRSFVSKFGYPGSYAVYSLKKAVGTKESEI